MLARPQFTSIRCAILHVCRVVLIAGTGVFAEPSYGQELPWNQWLERNDYPTVPCHRGLRTIPVRDLVPVIGGLNHRADLSELRARATQSIQIDGYQGRYHVIGTGDLPHCERSSLWSRFALAAFVLNNVFLDKESRGESEGPAIGWQVLHESLGVGGSRVMHLQQTVNNIPVYGALATITFTLNGTPISLSASPVSRSDLSKIRERESNYDHARTGLFEAFQKVRGLALESFLVKLESKKSKSKFQIQDYELVSAREGYIEFGDDFRRVWNLEVKQNFYIIAVDSSKSENESSTRSVMKESGHVLFHFVVDRANLELLSSFETDSSGIAGEEEPANLVGQPCIQPDSKLSTTMHEEAIGVSDISAPGTN